MFRLIFLHLTITLQLGALWVDFHAFRRTMKTEDLLRMNARDELMSPTYHRLASMLMDDRLTKLGGDQQQYWVGIAGGPGSGKSTLAASVRDIINDKAGTDIAVVLPMDGYHYSRKELKSIADMGEYSFEELLARRGSPWTFNAAKIVSSARRSGSAVLNTYSRQLSDPVEGGVELKASHRIVLCEGNYLLNFDDESWSGLREVFDEKWFISCKHPEQQRTRLIMRHLETWTAEKERMWGPGEIGAANKADANDVLNAIFVENHKTYADVLIESI